MMVALEDVISEVQSGFASGSRLASGTVQLRMNNVAKDGGLLWDSVTRVPTTARQIKALSLKPGDVLFNSTNSPEMVGKTALFNGYQEPVVFSNHFLRLRVDVTQLDAGFLAFWLLSQWQSRVFENLATQWVNQATVRREDLLSLEIPLPPLPKQQRLAALLDKADHLRRTRRYAQHLSDTFLQSVFLEMFGDPATNPKGWDITQIGEHTKLVSSGSTPLGGSNVYKTEGIRFIRSQNVLMSGFDFSDVAYIDSKTHRTMKRTWVQCGDVLINITGASIGRVAHYLDQTDANVNQHVCIIRLTAAPLTPVFLAFLMSQPSFQDKIFANQSGATRQALTFDQIKDFAVILPPLALQEQFAQVVRRTERLRGQQREAARQAEHLFQTLLFRAFRGEA